jgi:hypothetical protein
MKRSESVYCVFVLRKKLIYIVSLFYQNVIFITNIQYDGSKIDAKLNVCKILLIHSNLKKGI